MGVAMKTKRILGGCIIGMLSGLFGLPVYDFQLHYFSFHNLLIVSGFLGLWYLLCENGGEI